MIKYILAIILIYGSYTLSRRYVSSLYERLECEIAILEIFEHIRDKMKATYAPMLKIVSSFSSPPLEEAGFLPIKENEKNLHSAFLAAKGFSEIDREVFDEGAALFDKIGTSDIETELSRLNSGCERLSARVEFLKEEHKKREKTAVILSLGISLGIVILLL